MRPIRQLLRQPLRTLIALVVLTASVAFMCLSWGIYKSSLATADAIEDSFVTLLTYNYNYLERNTYLVDITYPDGTVKKEKMPLIDRLSYESTRITEYLRECEDMRDIYDSKLVTAVSDARPVISYEYGQGNSLVDRQYFIAVGVFELTDFEFTDDGLGSSDLEIHGKIKEMPALMPELLTPERVTIRSGMLSEEQRQEMEGLLEVGKTYIFDFFDDTFGNNGSYRDMSLDTRSHIVDVAMWSQGIDISVNDVVLTPENIKMIDGWPMYTLPDGTPIVSVNLSDLSNYGLCEGSLNYYVDYPEVWTEEALEEWNSQPHTAYQKQLALVPGTLEEFLADNPDWAERIEARNLQLRALPVIGTDLLESMALFYDKTIYISDGETFSPEDYASGSRVCIIPKTLADKNGLQVGDTLKLDLYSSWDLHSISTHMSYMHGTCTPENYSGVSGDFVIKGVYTNTAQFEDSANNIAPNTVFVPKSALEGVEGYTDNSAVLESLVIKNGHIDEVKSYLEAGEFDMNYFLFNDGGYSQVSETVSGIRDSADDQLLASAAAVLAALAAYLALFVLRLRRDAGRMLSLGAGRGRAAWYIIVESTVPAVVSTALGAGIGCLMLNSSVRRVVEEASNQLGTSFSGVAASGSAALDNVVVVPSAALLAGAALLALYVVVFTLAALITAARNPRKLMKK